MEEDEVDVLHSSIQGNKMRLYQKAVVLKETFYFDFPDVYFSSYECVQRIVDCIILDSSVRCLISGDGDDEYQSQVVSFPSAVDCCCFDATGEFLVAATSDGRIHFSTISNGILFSQRVMSSLPESGRCFVSLQWLEGTNDELLIAVTSDGDLLVFSGLSLALLRKYMESDDTDSLITQRDNTTLLRFSFRETLSRITCFIAESSDSFLLGGEGKDDLIRVRLADGHTGILRHLQHGAIHTGCIKKMSIEGMFLLVLYDDGSLFCLYREMFSPVSFFRSMPVIDMVLLPSTLSPNPNQAYALLVVQQEQQKLLSVSIRYGDMTVVSEESHGESLHFLPSHSHHLLVLNQAIHRKESQRTSMTITLTRLQMATEFQQLIMLIKQDSFDEAFRFAESHQLSPVLIWCRQLQCIIRQWRETLDNVDWVTSPAVDCEPVFEILRKAPSSLFFYVLSSDFIPSLATVTCLIHFIKLYITEEESVKYNVLELKWNLFLQLLYNEEHVTAQTWQRFYQMPLLDLQNYFLRHGNVKAVLLLWDLFSPAGSLSSSLQWPLEVKELWKGSLESFIRCACRRQEHGFLINDDLLKWLQRDVLPHTNEQEKIHFVEWLEAYCEQQLQRGQWVTQYRNQFITVLHNLMSLTSIVSQFPLLEQEERLTHTERILKIHHYLLDLCSIADRCGLMIVPSPAAELPSNEELVIQLLDELQNVEIFTDEFQSRVVPFCAYRNMNVDEVLSFYVKQQLESSSYIEMSRLEQFWRMINSYELRIKALQGVEMRSPPFPNELISLFEESSHYCGDVSATSHSFVCEQYKMLQLRNRINERGLDALVYTGSHAGFIISETLMSRWDSNTIEDLKLLCSVYKDVDYSECLESLAMRLLEESQPNDLLQSVLEECCVVCDGFAFISIIRYVFQLMDEEGREDSWWSCCIKRLSLIISTVMSSTNIQGRLYQQGLEVDHLRKCIEKMIALYGEFSIKLMSDFFLDTEEVSDLLIRGCVSESGYQNAIMSLSVHLASFTSLLRISNILQTDPILLTVYLCDALVITVHETNPSTYSLLNEMNKLMDTVSHRQSSTSSNCSSCSNNTLEEMIRLLLNDVFFVMLQLLEKESTRSSLDIVQLLVRLAQKICSVSLHIDTFSLSLYSFISSRSAELTALVKLIELTHSTPFDDFVLPLVFYEEEGLSLDVSTVSTFLLMYLQHSINGNEITPAMLSETLTCFTTHQIELTTLPLIRQIVRSQPSLRSVAPDGFDTLSGANWPVQFIVEQVIQRMLQFCWKDAFPLLSCIDIIPIHRASSLLKQGIVQTDTQPEVAVEIAALGVAYCHLLRILHPLREFQQIYRNQFWKSFLYTHCNLRDVSMNTVRSSLPQLVSDASCVTADLIQLCTYANMDEMAIGRELMTLAVRENQQRRVKEIIHLLLSRLEPSQMVKVLQTALKETENRAMQKLLFVELDELQRQYEMENASTHTSLVVFDFCESHDELMHDANIAQLISDPWSILSTRVTLFNYLQFLLLFDLLSITMQDVVIHLLQQLIAHNAIPPDWREIHELLGSYPDEDHSQERASLCLQLSKLYSHSPTPCTSSPCTRCQDSIAAAEFALGLCKAVLTASYRSNEQTNEADAERLSLLMRDCRMHHACAVYFFQFNRLSLGQYPVPKKLLPNDLYMDCCQHFDNMEKHLQDLYFHIGTLAGAHLRLHFTEILQGSTSLRLAYSKMEGKSRKRMSDRDSRSDSGPVFLSDLPSVSFDHFTLIEVRDMIEQLRDESHLAWFPFSDEGGGVFFVHSVMELLCELFQLSFPRILISTVDQYMQHWEQISADGLCEEEEEDNRLHSAENGLIYMWQGLREMDGDVCLRVTAQYIHRALSPSLTLSFAAKHLIFASIACFLSFLSIQEQKRFLLAFTTRDKAFTLAELKQHANVMRIHHTCHKYRIPAGTDVLSQVQNPSFLSNILRSHPDDRNVFWWCASLMQQLTIQDLRVWDQLLSLAVKQDFLPLCILCLLQHQRIARLHMNNEGLLERNEILQMVNQVVLKCLDPAKPLFDESLLALIREFTQDVDVSSWCEAMCNSLVMHPQSNGLAEGLCGAILCVLDASKRRELLRKAIDAGAAMAVCEHICCEGNIVASVKEEFVMAFRKEMKEGHFDALFFSDFYNTAIEVCMEEEDAKQLLNEWISYHIRHKHFKDAVSLVMKTGWNDDQSWDGNDIFILRDYVRDALHDESLLCYLLNISSVL